MKKALLVSAIALSLAGGAFAQDAHQGTGDGSLNTIGTIIGENGDYNHVTRNSNNVGDVNGDTYTGTVVQNSQKGSNGYISNPNLTTSGADTCFGSKSGGISAAGFGISGGETVIDQNCIMLKNAKLLSSLGLKDAAVALLVNSNSDIAKAVSQAYPHLITQLYGVQNGTTINDNRITVSTLD